MSRQKYRQTHLFQTAAARSARPDSEPPAGNDSFAALVDSNTAASNNDNSHPGQRARPRRSDDAQAASDNRSRANAAASDKADKARNDSNDRNAAAKARSDKARDEGNVDAKAEADTETDTKAATTRRAKSKSDAAKSDGAKSDETTQASSGDAPGNRQTETARDATAVVTADAIAVAIPAARGDLPRHKQPTRRPHRLPSQRRRSQPPLRSPPRRRRPLPPLKPPRPAPP